MKHTLNMISLSAAAFLLLSACGTGADESADGNPGNTEESQQENMNDDQPENTDSADQDEENGETGESEDATGTDDAGEQDSADEGNDQERELSYLVDEETQTGQASLQESDEQSYSIYTLDGYELTSEEPGKDVLYWSEDEQIFMRIETFGEDADHQLIADGLSDQLEYAGGDAQDVSGDYELTSDEGIEDLIVLQAENESGITTGAMFVKNGMIVKLTVFDQSNGDRTGAFLSMGATIEKK